MIRRIVSNSPLEDELALQIRAFELLPPTREFKYAIPGRRFKFDFAWEEERLLVEVQGATYVRGGHSTGTGIARDMEKLNLATLAGWRVLQFDSKMIKTGAAIEIINQALEITK